MTETALGTTSEQDATRQRNLALLKAVGLDRLAPEQRELALNIAKKYELDLLLKHLVIIEGRAYITRDGLLHIAHRSGQLDGIETTEPEIRDGFWRVSATVYRKDMTRGFTYFGRYPTSGGNQKFAPEMATKVAEVMSLRRAFDVAAPTAEERWDTEVTAPEPEPPKTLRERVTAKQKAIAAPVQDPAPTDDFYGAAATDDRVTRLQHLADTSENLPDCGAEDKGLDTGPCVLAVGHDGPHKNATGVWPQ